jgi:predicted permease
VVLFVAGLFVATFNRLSHRSTGFSVDRLLVIDTVSQPPQSPLLWEQLGRHLKNVPGVERIAFAKAALLDGWASNSFISIRGAPPSDTLAYFLGVSPGWTEVMKIPLIDGRDFRRTDLSPGAAIVNETFAKQFFKGENPVGRSFDRGPRLRFEIVGLVRDVCYRSIREQILPIAYVPFAEMESGVLQKNSRGTFIIRTTARNPLTLASALRHDIPKAQPGFRVSNIRTQKEINDSQTVRERLVATLALFFAGVALTLAGVGLYGVLDYSVLQRQREIGIRMAVGARVSAVARQVTAGVFGMVVIGAFAGLLLGMAAVRYVASLFYDVKATDADVLLIPTLAITAATLVASVPAILRAARIDPVKILRSE